MDTRISCLTCFFGYLRIVGAVVDLNRQYCV